MSGNENRDNEHGAYCRRDSEIATLQSEVKHLGNQDTRFENVITSVFGTLTTIQKDITQLKIGQTELRGNSSTKIMLAHAVGGMIPVVLMLAVMLASGQIKLW